MNSRLIAHCASPMIFFVLISLSVVGCGGSGKPVAAEPHARVIQPNYERWLKVAPGMSEAEVDRLLGPPLSRQEPHPGVTRYGAIYCEIRFGSAHFDAPYTFDVEYDAGTRRVIGTNDPFERKLSTDGKPTVPQLMHPNAGEEFSHFPRLVDFRWQPSSGEYPMTYEIQIRLNDFAYYDWGRFTVVRANVDEPYFLCSLGGKNSWLWRVRAVNRLGKSEWSEERGYKFDW